jgi:hypothetical protein
VKIPVITDPSWKCLGPIPRRAIEQMGTYQPAQHEETTSVAPLLQFFELVHIGDTIQSMVQVYFDKELVSGNWEKAGGGAG